MPLRWVLLGIAPMEAKERRTTPRWRKGGIYIEIMQCSCFTVTYPIRTSARPGIFGAERERINSIAGIEMRR